MSSDSGHREYRGVEEGDRPWWKTGLFVSGGEKLESAYVCVLYQGDCFINVLLAC